MITPPKIFSTSIKASFVFFLANFVTAGMSYITTPLFTRLLSTEEFGQTAIFLTWLQLFGIVAMFCLSSGVFNNGMIDFENNRSEFSLSMLGLSNIITFIFTVVICLFYPVVKKILIIEFPLVILLCLIYFLQPAYNFWLARQRYELKYKNTFIWSSIVAVISPISAVLAIVMSKNRLYGRIYGGEIPLVLIYIGFYLYLMYKGNFKIEKKYWKYALRFNFPLIPHYLSMYILGSSDRLMISNLINNSATAFYSVAYSIASMSLIVWSAINSTLIPFTYENCKRQSYENISKVANPLILVFALTCAFVILLGPEVLSIMATSEYNEAVLVIPPVVGGVFFQVQYFLYANIVFYHKSPKYIMFASISATIINIILNYIFIPKYGYIAAGYTTLFSYVVQAILDFLAMRYVVKKNVYDIRFILQLSIIVICVSLLSDFLYNSIWIRYSLIGLVLFLIFVFRNKLINAVFVKNI